MMKNMRAIWTLIFLLTGSVLSGYSQDTAADKKGLNPAVQQKLTLEACKQMALQQDHELHIAVQKAEAAKQLKKAAQTQYLPNISATGMYLYNSKNLSLLQHDMFLPIGTLGTDGKFTVRPDQMANTFVDLGNGVSVPLDASGNPFDPRVHPEKIQFKDYAYIPKEALEVDMKQVFSVGVNLVQPVFMGGKIRELNRIAEASVRLANAQTDAARLEVLTLVEQAYWQVVSVEKKQELARAYANLLQKMESDVQQLLTEGQATRSDLLSVQVKSNEAQQQLAKVENGLALAKMLLCKQIGWPLNADVHPADDVLSLSPSDMASPLEMQDILANRAEIKSLTQLTKIANSAVNIQKSRFLPTVGLTAGWIGANPNPYNGFSSTMGGAFSVGLAVNVPIFHFGERVYTLRAAEFEQRAAVHKLDEAKEMITLQVQQLTYKVREAMKRVYTAEKHLELAQENLRSAQEGFKEGVLKSSDVLMAQTAWLSAQAEQIDARIDYKMCSVHLKKAEGNSK